MEKRTSVVDKTYVINVGLSSVFHVGDSFLITPRSKALAIQRQLQLYYSYEGVFEDYQIFQRAPEQHPFTEAITFSRHNPCNFIKVKEINLTSLSGTGVYQIGATNCINAEARIKHIRQIYKLPDE